MACQIEHYFTIFLSILEQTRELISRKPIAEWSGATYFISFLWHFDSSVLHTAYIIIRLLYFSWPADFLFVLFIIWLSVRLRRKCNYLLSENDSRETKIDVNSSSRKYIIIVEKNQRLTGCPRIESKINFKSNWQ